DLGEMRDVGSTDQVNIVAEFDRIGSDHQTERYLIQRDGVDEPVDSLGETDCGDPRVLLSFIKWAAEEYPAERYALILWNHGGGWEPSEIERIARSVQTRDYSPVEATERSASSLGRAFFRTTWQEILGLASVQDRAICSDDGSGHSLDTIELGNVLEQAVEALGQPLDLLGMDACLMSNLEVAYQARPFVRYVVASEENEPNNGWPYDRVLRYLVDNPDAETADLARHIVQAYVDSYTEIGYSGAVTQSALDLARVEVLAEPLDVLSDALVPRMSDAKREIGEALYRTSANFWRGTLWDIAHFCQELASETEDEGTRQASLAVKAALQPESSALVIAEAHHGQKVAHCGGTTVYLPPRILHKVSRYYSELDYAQAHRWLAMLESYHAA
ncbi:MAG: clostripain-related cysteine peptidase, partial [Anaerolineae bacterium]